MAPSPPQRRNASLVQPIERPLLLWIAARIPSRVNSNHLTMLGLFGAFVTMLGYAATNAGAGFLWLASAGLVVNWAGDSLDGTLARLRRVERARFGLYIDHVTDLASQILIMGGLGLSPYLRFDVACLGLIAYLSFSIIAFLRCLTFGELAISYGGVGPTELRIGLLVLNALVALFPPWIVVGGPWPLSSADCGVLLALVFIVAVMISTVIGDARRLSQADPAVRS